MQARTVQVSKVPMLVTKFHQVNDLMKFLNVPACLSHSPLLPWSLGSGPPKIGDEPIVSAFIFYLCLKWRFHFSTSRLSENSKISISNFVRLHCGCWLDWSGMSLGVLVGDIVGVFCFADSPDEYLSLALWRI